MSERERLRPRRAALRLRSELLGATRQFFRDREFLEIEAPVLVRSPGLEVHIRAVEAGGGYLSTSPEYALKRLLVAGLERVFSLGKCFRAEERGAHHSVEFSMLEWYRANQSLEAIETDCEELIRSLSSGSLVVGAKEIDTAADWKRLPVRDLFADCASIEMRGDESDESFLAKVRAAGHDVGSATAFDDVFYTVWLDKIDPLLARQSVPVFVTDWPSRLAALARENPNDGSVVERFELYIGGVELANAFGELTDAATQRARFEQEQRERAARGLPVYPIDEKFLAALEEGMPPSAGVALGFDRLVMLLAGAASIGDVQAFANDEV